MNVRQLHPRQAPRNERGLNYRRIGRRYGQKVVYDFLKFLDVTHDNLQNETILASHTSSLNYFRHLDEQLCLSPHFSWKRASANVRRKSEAKRDRVHRDGVAGNCTGVLQLSNTFGHARTGQPYLSGQLTHSHAALLSHAAIIARSMLSIGRVTY